MKNVRSLVTTGTTRRILYSVDLRGNYSKEICSNAQLPQTGGAVYDLAG